MRKDYELAVEMIKRTGLDAQVVVINKNNITQKNEPKLDSFLLDVKINLVDLMTFAIL